MPKKRLSSGTNAFYISGVLATTFASAQHISEPRLPGTLPDARLTGHAAYLARDAAYREFRLGPVRLTTSCNGAILPHRRWRGQTNKNGADSEVVRGLS